MASDHCQFVLSICTLQSLDYVEGNFSTGINSALACRSIKVYEVFNCYTQRTGMR